MSRRSSQIPSRRSSASARAVSRLHPTLLCVAAPADYERFVQWRARVALSAECDRWVHVSALLYQTIYRQPVRYDYPLLRPPTFLVVGAEARTAVMRQYGNRADTAEMGNFPVLAQAACREMARCELIVIPQTGHVPHLEHPDAFIERLLGFLNSNAASAADRP